MYSIEDLEKLFLEHAEQSEKMRQDSIDSFKKNRPGDSLPDHMSDEFNFPRAMAAICSAILDIKNEKNGE